MRFSRFACCFAMLFSAFTCFAQMYTITDIGSSTVPKGINMQGTVVGEFNRHAFIWKNTSGIQDLGLLPGGTFSSAAAINDLGVVAGTADGPGTMAAWPPMEDLQCGNISQPFIWTQDYGMTSVGTVPLIPRWDTPEQACAHPFYATDINASGQVSGVARGADDYQWGFEWTSTGMTLFGGSWPPTYANGINNAGRVVGQDMTAGDGGRYIGNAASWKNGVMTYLPNLTGIAPLPLAWPRYPSVASDINDLEQIVGWSYSPDFLGFHAVLWAYNGGIRDLGTLPGDTLSAASRINFYGEVIGSSGNEWNVDLTTWNLGEGPFWNVGGGPVEVLGRPFIWSESGGMKNLNALVSPDSGWVINVVTDISSEGLIVGQGALNGEFHGLLLSPIYRASVQQPINSDGSSVFNAKRGVVPVKFRLAQYDLQTCPSIPATITITRISGGTLGAVDESTYLTNADAGSNFRIDPSACQYVYNLGASSLGVGQYQVDISINGIMVGHSVFALK